MQGFKRVLEMTYYKQWEDRTILIFSIEFKSKTSFANVSKNMKNVIQIALN